MIVASVHFGHDSWVYDCKQWHYRGAFWKVADQQSGLIGSITHSCLSVLCFSDCFMFAPALLGLASCFSRPTIACVYIYSHEYATLLQVSDHLDGGGLRDVAYAPVTAS